LQKQLTTSRAKKMKLRLQVLLIKEGEYFVAYCPALELSAYDTTPDGARKAFEQNLKIFLEETRRKGTLEKYLLSLGWMLRKSPGSDYQQPSIESVNLSSLKHKRIENIFNEAVEI